MQSKFQIFGKSKHLFILVMMFVLLSSLPIASVLAETDGKTYTIQADDWLSKLADKEYGNLLAYKAIVHYTNQKAKTDPAFTPIHDPDQIEVGWTIYLPTTEDAAAYLTAGEQANLASEVVIGVGRNLYYGHSDWHPIHGSLNVWESLIYPDENLNPQPVLAKSWSANADNTEWTITLKEGIYFHDGTPLTADVAVYNLLGAHENYTPLATLDRIEAVDDTIVKIYLTAPTPTLPNLLGGWQSAMFSPATHQQQDKDYPVPYGTGPYMFKEYVDGEKIVLVRNEAYWGEPAKTERIIYRYIPDANTRLLALQSGEIDAIADVGSIMPSQGALVESDGNLNLYLQDVVTTHYLFFNNDKAPFDNPTLRRAVSMALDRELVVNEAVYGYGVPATGNLTQLATSWVNPNAKPVYDPEQAKALAQSVLGDERMSVTFVLNSGLANRWPYAEIAQIIQYSLADLGLDVDIQTVEGGTWNEMLGNDEYDLSMRPYTMSSGDPDDFMTYWARSNGIFNKKYSISYADAHVEELIAEAIAEVDPATRKAYYDELQTIFIEQTPFTPIYHEVTLYAARKNVSGLSLDPIFNPSLATVYKAIE
jgi:peptide/nickel transport system substrate-binding protein